MAKGAKGLKERQERCRGQWRRARKHHTQKEDSQESLGAQNTPERVLLSIQFSGVELIEELEPGDVRVAVGQENEGRGWMEGWRDGWMDG